MLCRKHKIGKYSLIKLKNLHLPRSWTLSLGLESYSCFQAVFCANGGLGFIPVVVVVDPIGCVAI